MQKLNSYPSPSFASPRLRALRDFLKQGTRMIALAVICTLSIGCATIGETSQAQGDTSENDAGQEVTVIIALSAIPRGIVGHSGIAIGQSFWDYGPDRVDTKQRLQGLGSPAGPWWDDPEQDWQDGLSLDEVLAEMPKQVHPDGSVVVMFRVRVTDDEAAQIAAYWNDVYDAMREEQADYHLIGWQCSNVVCHSMGASGSLPARDRAMAGTPLVLRVMTPTVLYLHLRTHLRNTAGPNRGRRASVQWLELHGDRMRPYQLPLAGLIEPIGRWVNPTSNRAVR